MYYTPLKRNLLYRKQVVITKRTDRVMIKVLCEINLKDRKNTELMELLRINAKDNNSENTSSETF